MKLKKQNEIIDERILLDLFQAEKERKNGFKGYPIKKLFAELENIIQQESDNNKIQYSNIK